MTLAALEDFVGSMTLAELSTHSGASIQAIVEYALGGSTHRSSSERPRAGPTVSRSTRRGNTVNTRTPEGRAKLDAAVLDALHKAGGLTKAAALREQVGGTTLQVRAALNRLIETGAVVFEGRARATRYAAA